MKNMLKEITHELKEHVPFTALATIIGTIISLLILKLNFITSIVPIFYIFHPIHLFFSTLVSTAIIYNYKKKILFSIIAGGLISLIIGSLSDVIFPYLGALIFKIPISFNLPEIKIPFIIFPVIIFGAIIGIISKKTKFPHFIHVFISVFASLFYMFAYSSNWNLINLILIVIITTISVVIPCCLGDIVLPIIINNKIKNKK